MNQNQLDKMLADPQTRKTLEDAFINDPHVKSVVEHAEDSMSTMQSFASTANAWFHAKWTCEGCGERVVATPKNAWHLAWHHEDCGESTLSVDGDLGYLIAAPSSSIPEVEPERLLPVDSLKDIPSKKGMYEWLKSRKETYPRTPGPTEKTPDIDGHNRHST